MNIALWIVQGLLALVMFGAGTTKLVSPRTQLVANPHMAWAGDFTDGQVKLIGLAEIAGAVGLIAPWATHLLPILTPIAAACLGFIMLGAVRTHAGRKEPWAPPLVLAALCAF